MKPARALAITFDKEHFVLHLEDGRRLAVPLEWYPTLKAAATEMRERFEFFTVVDAQFLKWRGLDLTLAIDGLLVSQGPIHPWEFDGNDRPGSGGAEGGGDG